MCGIVGYIGSRSSVDVLLKGLKQLEYRGYDSTGVALMMDSPQKGAARNRIEILKSEGKLQNVEKLVADSVTSASPKAEKERQDLHLSHCGIGHTRWATHGRPTTQNAHPHRAGHVVLVHNGIIENYLEIRQELIQGGYQPISETDSELFAFLVLQEMERGLRLPEAVRRSFQRIHGQCSFVVLSEKEPGTIVGARRGSPLVAALDPAGGCAARK
jgi:glucosamine--fructose-6-phosphate aminotransferase (isomerizing)